MALAMPDEARRSSARMWPLKLAGSIPVIRPKSLKVRRKLRTFFFSKETMGKRTSDEEPDDNGDTMGVSLVEQLAVAETEVNRVYPLNKGFRWVEGLSAEDKAAFVAALKGNKITTAKLHQIAKRNGYEGEITAFRAFRKMARDGRLD